ncbi:phosphoribosylformylglycinamidine synthase II [Sulfobacillus acidophilus TPY]|uniref:Phosphoribosylformylglycinamidine synthase subunit PurL n=1 Tax=Sulfobacillus acidophilus (strain ATCC 700253 / DSM 10332 / NAL) TaxID=679936 RepID=G8TXD2_SULAD|nr:phosphoribosylformylglycinamidine synthase II [Sulfobacillus acidophilus TPY]AEW06134.1 phosphoribosylformylglycinamidine synthase subunit II [Sulfobacillus acidophilus DSM 10332]
MQPEDVGLTRAEYQEVLRLMGRTPNDLELGLFGALWSEHCSYKNSKGLLKHLPHQGPHVVTGPGGNAGVVRLTPEWEVAFKIESHNHPSYVEPEQGAATGVGGIIRDIVAMGARPVALADALRFGEDEASQVLLDGVVRGVGMYGNAIGIPTVTGDIGFGPGYAKNPLVNVLAVGIRSPRHKIGADTAQPGSLLVLWGRKTGRDGIHGASLLASRDFSGGDDDLRPTVQVGDPFLGKLVMEATLMAVAEGILDAVQDLGAAGLTSATAELLARSGVGAELWLDQVPVREAGMTPYEIMLSETQERMLLVVPEAQVERVIAIARHWEVPWAVIGRVTERPRLQLFFAEELVGEVHPAWLADEVPLRPVTDDFWQQLAEPLAPPAVSSATTVTLTRSTIEHLWQARDCRDRQSVYRQYDSMIQTHTVWGPDHDLAILQLKGVEPGLAVAVSGPGRWAAGDAYAAGFATVLRVLAVLAAQGAEPLGLTDGINAGNPYKPEAFQALAALLRGIADAARLTGVPVTGGNVSLHNETDGQAIWPTGIIGVVGRHDRPRQPVPDALQAAGHALWLIHPPARPEAMLGGSVWARLTGWGAPYSRSSDPEADHRALEWVRRSVTAPGVRACRAVGDGGALLTLTRMWLAAESGLGLETHIGPEAGAVWVNEAVPQWIMEVETNGQDRLAQSLADAGLTGFPIATVTPDGIFRLGSFEWTRTEVLAYYRQPYTEEVTP